jgi:hypothetical protein
MMQAMRRKRWQCVRVLAWTVAAWLTASAGTAAHPAPFSYLDLRLHETGVDGSLIVHDLDVAHDVGVDPPERLLEAAVANRYRDILTRLMDSRIAVRLDGERVAASKSCPSDRASG